MHHLQAFRYRIQPTGEQERLLRRFAGSCRYVFNEGLTLQRTRYEQGQPHLSYAGLCAQLVRWKADPATAWLTLAPSQALQQALKDLDRAYGNFFANRAQYPQRKKKGRHEAVRFPQGVRLDHANNRLYLPKLGWVRYRNSRLVLGTVKNVTVSQSSGKWFVSIQTEREVPTPVPTATSAVGIDLGIVRFATLSDGSHIEPLNSFKKHETRLRKAQRVMSRKVTFSQNWKKAKATVQRLHARIRHIRQDYLHKASTALSKTHAMVVMEDLQVRNLSKSAAGTVEQPGRHVRAKSGLNKTILDQGWAGFRRQLEYKLAWTGGWLVVVPPQYTSQTCAACGHVSADNRRTQARFECVACGHVDHADVNAAKNLLAAGHAVLACGGRGLPTKQEPTEATRALIA